MKNVCVIGLGYIGLPTALMLASSGVPVTGIDYNTELVESLNHGKLSFEEKGLENLYKKAIERNIKFTDSYTENDPAEVYIIAVPTPYNRKSKKIDPKYVISAVEEVLKICEKGTVITIESTISPGTIDKFIKPLIIEHGFKIGEDIHITHAPERIIPGNMIYELEHNSRVIGCDDKIIGEEIKNIYSSFCKGEIVITDIRTAEMTKVVENTFRDINIAFANELCKICGNDGLDVYEIIRIANMHPRINILSPGPGVGGHCISVDPWFLVGDYPELSLLIHEARKINDSMPDFVLERLADIIKETGIKDKSRIGLYGLTYKEDVDDIRESPTLQLLRKIDGHLGMPLKVYDPMVKKNIFESQYQDFDKFLKDIDLIVIMVGHSHIKQNLGKIKDKIIFDTRNICKDMKAYKL